MSIGAAQRYYENNIKAAALTRKLNQNIKDDVGALQGAVDKAMGVVKLTDADIHDIEQKITLEGALGDGGGNLKWQMLKNPDNSDFWKALRAKSKELRNGGKPLTLYQNPEVKRIIQKWMITHAAPVNQFIKNNVDDFGGLNIPSKEEDLSALWNADTQAGRRFRGLVNYFLSSDNDRSEIASWNKLSRKEFKKFLKRS